MLSLSWRLLRGGGKSGMLGSLLMIAAVAVSTGLLMFTVAGNLAFGERAQAEAWRYPEEATGVAKAVEGLNAQFVRGKPVTVVDLAKLTDDAPIPPGMPRFPEPGETWVSPALGKLMRQLPADQLADRFPAQAGVLGRNALQFPEELVAVVGHEANALKGTDTRVAESRPPTKIDAFATRSEGNAFAYQALMGVASLFMIVPLLVFGGAAARLTVARRDQRLATLRLVGATPRQVVGLTVAESVLTALIGSVAGIVLYALSIPAIAQIRIAGGTWFLGGLWPGLLPAAAVMLAVPVLVGISAAVGLRRVVVSPLGVARRVTPPGMKARRMLLFLVLLACFGAISGSLPTMGKLGAVLFLTFLFFGYLGINLVGPWVVSLIGRAMVLSARGPSRLLAGRRLMDDPRSAWRTVGGVAMTGFVAGFLAVMSFTGLGTTDDQHLRMEATSVSQIKEALPQGTTITKDGEELSIKVPGGEPERDKARTTLTKLFPGTAVATESDHDATGRMLIADLRTGAFTVLTVSFLVAIVSAGVTSASSVLDRRQTYALLRLAGTPLKVLDRARRQETLIPLLVMGGGSVATGLLFTLPFSPGTFDAMGVATMLAFVGVGLSAVVGASALSRPLLRSVTADPAPRPD